jgi:multidrug efflux pump subunit AcrB
VERWIQYFASRRLLVNVILVVVLVLGWVQVSRAPRETFPNVTMPTLFVSGILPGASARDVETKITIPIQEVVEELDGLKSFETVVSDAVSRTEIELNNDFDDARVREAERDLRVLIDGIQDFPPEMEDDPTIQRLNPRLFPVVEIALAGPSDAIAEASKVLERRLRKLEQVSKVTVVGLPDPEIRILIDPDRARAHGVTLAEIADAVRRRNVSSTGGILESERDRRQVVLWSRFDRPEDVASTVIRFAPGGGALTIADVARIEVAREDTGLIAHTNGQPGLSIVVSKQEDADILVTVDTVVAEVAATPLPPGVTYTVTRDESFMARNRLQLMLNNGVVGAVLVAATLFVFLTPTAAIWTIAGIPTIFLVTIALFPLFGFSLNIVTLTGLFVVLGMVVDDAIVVTERIVARRQMGEPRRVAAVRGAAEMARPVLASAITTMLAFVPLWGLGGMPGKMTRSMPAVVILALAVSVIESFTILPAHMAHGSQGAPRPKPRFLVRLEEAYARGLRRGLRHRAKLVAGCFAALIAVFALLGPRMQVVLFPQDDAEALYMKLTLPVGTPIERTEAVAAEIERQLPALMGDDLIGALARIGHQDGQGFERTRGAAEHEAIVTALIRPLGRTHTASEWAEIFERELRVAPDARVIYEVEYIGPPVGRPVTLHVASNDDDVRRSIALDLSAWLAKQPELTNIDVDERPGAPQIELMPDYERLALRGLDPEAVGRTLAIAFQGMVASEHRDLDDTTDLRVMLDPSARRDLDALLELPVRSQRGDLVLLSDVVTPIEVPSVSSIYHRDGVRTATVTASFHNDSKHTPLSFAELVERDVLPRYAGVPGLAVTVGGEVVETRKTGGDLGLAALLAFAGITLVIALMLGSFLEAAFVVSIIPFAMGGVILTFFLHGKPLSMFAMMGAIGLAGVVVNSAIVMVDAVHRAAEAANTEAAREEVMIEAVVGRLRPIIATTLTTLGGVLPMAYGIGGHDAVVAPLSLALGWGLAIATGVTMFLVPALYTVATDLRRFDWGVLLRRERSAREGSAAEAAPR